MKLTEGDKVQDEHDTIWVYEFTIQLPKEKLLLFVPEDLHHPGQQPSMGIFLTPQECNNRMKKHGETTDSSGD